MIRKSRQTLQSVRACLRQAAEQSGLTLEEIGLRMGYSKSGARQAVSRLLNPKVNYDPRLGTLLAFAEAVEQPLKSLL